MEASWGVLEALKSTGGAGSAGSAGGGGFAEAPLKDSLGFLSGYSYVYPWYFLRNRKVKKDMRRKGR